LHSALQRALYYQPDCGLSGDMHLAALIDLGVPQDWLRRELARLPIAAEFTLTVNPAHKMGIHGTRAQVSTTDQHDHRHHASIVKMIEQAGYAAGVQRRALDIFQRIAVAEAKIHDIPVERVHFHEVGAVDSIVDIVAAALCLEHLQPEIVICNPVELGAGFVDCAHGRFPVPAPATQELLVNVPCTYGGVQGEATTPTGAAILAASVDEFAPTRVFRPERIGYGIGHKDFEKPNVLRVAIGQYATAPDIPDHADNAFQHYKIEANIDDMSPEAYEPLMQTLFEHGAVDVYTIPITMKKSRPAQCLVAICGAGDKDRVADALLNHSSTIGLRMLPFAKRVLPREQRIIATTMGDVGVKVVIQPDGRTRWKPEHEGVMAIARAQGLDYPTTRRQIEHEIALELSGERST